MIRNFSPLFLGTCLFVAQASAVNTNANRPTSNAHRPASNGNANRPAVTGNANRPPVKPPGSANTSAQPFSSTTSATTVIATGTRVSSTGTVVTNTCYSNGTCRVTSSPPVAAAGTPGGGNVGPTSSNSNSPATVDPNPGQVSSPSTVNPNSSSNHDPYPDFQELGRCDRAYSECTYAARGEASVMRACHETHQACRDRVMAARFEPRPASQPGIDASYCSSELTQCLRNFAERADIYYPPGSSGQLSSEECTQSFLNCQERATAGRAQASPQIEPWLAPDDPMVSPEPAPGAGELLAQILLLYFAD